MPGSQAVKKEAESLGLDKIFESAGAEWRESGCSMCLGMNGDTVGNGQLAVTSNRNFEDDKGKEQGRSWQVLKLLLHLQLLALLRIPENIVNFMERLFNLAQKQLSWQSMTLIQIKLYLQDI